MRKILSIILLFPSLCFSQEIDSIFSVGRFVIKNNEYVFQKVVKGIFIDSNGLLDSSQQEIDFVIFKNNEKILNHKLRKSEADCNSVSLELGTYSLTDTSIKFYSYYAWIGGCCALPFGVREQTYKLDNSGNFFLAKSYIYLERYKEKYSEMNLKDRAKWVLQTENGYKAKFVFGEKGLSLIKNVKAKLAKQIINETKHWDNSYLAKRFGFKR